jgi:MATE family multidrug resistance protein
MENVQEYTMEESLLPETVVDAKAKTDRVAMYKELKLILTLSWPVALATLFRLAVYSTDTAFVGHLGTDELTGSGLAQSWISVLSVFAYSGAYALNSVCAQAIGAGNPTLAGNWLQLSLLIVFFISIPVTLAHFFTDPVLTFVEGSNNHIGRAIGFAQTFNEWSSTSFLVTVVYMAIRQFFQAMQIVRPATIVSALTVGVNIGLNQLLIFGIPSAGWDGWGFAGSPLATTFSLFFQLAVFYTYAIAYKQYHKPYWGGWTLNSFKKERVVAFLKVVAPMTIGGAFENWGFQVVTFASGRLGTDAAAAMQVMYAVWGILWAFYWGWGLALQVRIGSRLGDGDVAGAKLVARLSLTIVVAMVGLACCGCYLLRRPLIRLFTQDEKVVDLAAGAMHVMMADYFLGCIQLCAENILEGMCRNTIMAVISGVGTWLVFVPVTVYFGFHCPWFAHSQIEGLWWASVVGCLFKAGLLWGVIWCTSWEEMARLAQERSEKDKGVDKGKAEAGEGKSTDDAVLTGTAAAAAEAAAIIITRMGSSVEQEDDSKLLLKKEGRS